MSKPQIHNKNTPTIESPCIRNCCLDQQDICLGCFRHIDEITGWGQFSDSKKAHIIENCQFRRAGEKN